MKAWTRGLLWLGPTIAALHASSGNIIRTKIRSAPASPSGFFFYCLAPTKYQNIYVCGSVGCSSDGGGIRIVVFAVKQNQPYCRRRQSLHSIVAELILLQHHNDDKGVQLCTYVVVTLSSASAKELFLCRYKEEDLLRVDKPAGVHHLPIGDSRCLSRRCCS